jgi:hypothetical protein
MIRLESVCFFRGKTPWWPGGEIGGIAMRWRWRYIAPLSEGIHYAKKVVEWRAVEVSISSRRVVENEELCCPQDQHGRFTWS